MNGYRFFVILTILALGCGNLIAQQTPAIEQLMAQANELQAAFDQGDASKIIEKTYPSIYQMFGSKERFIEITNKVMEQLQTMGVKITESKLTKPEKFYRAGKETVCFLPRQSVMEMKGMRIKSTGFLIAIQKDGANNWWFLDGAGLKKNPKLLWKLLPKMPKDVVLPETKQEVMQDK